VAKRKLPEVPGISPLQMAEALWRLEYDTGLLRREIPRILAAIRANPAYGGQKRGHVLQWYRDVSLVTQAWGAWLQQTVKAEEE
jgi:hypothetical protein